MSISLEEAGARVSQLKSEVDRSAAMHNVLAGRLAEAESLVAFLSQPSRIATPKPATPVKVNAAPKKKASVNPTPKVEVPVKAKRTRSKSTPKSVEAVAA